MDSISAKNAMKELTMVLLYLSRFTARGRFADADDFYAWKGYDFDILNELDDDDCICQGSHPSKSKSVYLTDKGIDLAQELMKKYKIEDWK